MSKNKSLLLLTSVALIMSSCSSIENKDEAEAKPTNTKYVFSNPQDPLLEALKEQGQAAKIEVAGVNLSQEKPDDYEVNLNTIKSLEAVEPVANDGLVQDIDRIIVRDEKVNYVTADSFNTAPVSEIHVASIKESEIKGDLPWNMPWKSQEAKSIEDNVETISSPALQSAETVISSATSGSEDIVENANAKVGECYGKVNVKGQFKTVQEQVVVQPEKIEVDTVPAKYSMVEEDIIIREQGVRYVEVPATYKTVKKEVVVEPEKKKMTTIPAQYKTVSERVLVQPARKVWKKGRGLIERKGSDGEIMCLVEEPAKYETITKRILVQAESTQTQIIPAVTKTVEMQVVERPAGVREEIIPAVKKKIARKVEAEPARTVERRIPAKYKTITKKVAISEDQLKWLPVLCDYNINQPIVKKLQTALAERGYYKDKIDGVFGSRTSNAISKFQRELGLESSGITLITLQKLGLSS